MTDAARPFDAKRFKALERAGFNRIAARYAEGAHLRTDLAAALIEAADLRPGQTVLDLASGPALLAQEAAARVAPDGWVLATDIAEGMLATAALALAALTDAPQHVTVKGGAAACRHAAPARPEDRAPPPLAPRSTAPAQTVPNLSARRDEGSRPGALGFLATDAEHLSLADERFDRVLAGLALFMFPHPERALREIHRVLRPGGRLALSVWGTREEVPLIGRAQDCIARLLPPPRIARPSVFRFGKPATLAALLTDAGYRDIRIEPCDFCCHFEDADSYWQSFLDLAGGVAESLTRLAPDIRARLREAVADDLEAHLRQPDEDRPGRYEVGARAWIASACKP